MNDKTRLGKELEELERTDPEVREAARRLDAAIDHVLARKDVPPVRFHKSTADHPVQPYTDSEEM
jgi:hypothetical protein